MRIIPAIDIIDGKCVRLEKGDYNKKRIYNQNPLEVALEFENHGIEFLHLVDLDGAKSHEIVNHKILEQIALKTKLNIDFGGGIKSEESLNKAIEYGANQITIGSLAVKQPEIFISWLQKLGKEKIILSADCRDNKIAINGWLEESDKQIDDFIRSFVSEGLQYTTVTDISKDGMLCGPSFDLYKHLISEFPNTSIIASGGVSSMEDLENLDKLNLDGVILGKSIYENRIDLKSLEKFSQC